MIPLRRDFLKPLSRAVWAVVLIGIVCASVGWARADVTAKQTATMTVYPPAATLRGMPAPEQAVMKRGQVTRQTNYVTYVKGKAARLEVPQDSYYFKQGKNSVSVTEPQLQAYFTETVKDFAGTGLAGSTLIASITATNKTAKIFGHLCREYRVTGRSSAGKLTGDIWAAADLPSTPIPLTELSFTPALMGQWSKVKGFPLKVDLNIVNAKDGRMNVNTVTQSVIVSPVDRSVLAIPKAYRKTRPPQP